MCGTPSTEAGNAFVLNVLVVDGPLNENREDCHHHLSHRHQQIQKHHLQRYHHLQVNDGRGVLDPLTSEQPLDHIDQLWLHCQVDHCFVQTNLIIIMMMMVIAMMMNDNNAPQESRHQQRSPSFRPASPGRLELDNLKTNYIQNLKKSSPGWHQLGRCESSGGKIIMTVITW